MVAFPPGWGNAYHRPAQSGPDRGVWFRPMQRIPIQRYSQRISGVPLQPGQAQTVISATGGGSVTVGPTGIGNVWYPTQCTISTTTGVLDGSTFSLYQGPSGVPTVLVGTLFPGGAGTIALALPPMSPGQYLIGVWTGGHTGDVAAMNVLGTMDALAAV